MTQNEYNNLLQNIVNEPYENLLNIAQNALTDILPFFNSIAKDGNGGSYVIPFICTALAADGSFTELEHRLANDLVGSSISYDDFKDMVQEYYTDEWFDLVDKVADVCPTDLKSTLILFCLAFVAVDERISKEENAFIAKLLA